LLRTSIGRINIACVASVSVGLSAGLRHFSPPLPLPAAYISVALGPIFAPPKSEKRLERAAENPTETLATQARINIINYHFSKVFLKPSNIRVVEA